MELLAYLENPVLIEGSRAGDQRYRNRARASDASVSLGCNVVPRPMPVAAKRAPVVFADFEEGTPPGPSREGLRRRAGARGRGVQKLSGFEGNGLVNSWQDSDAARGKLVSPEFTIRYPYINS